MLWIVDVRVEVPIGQEDFPDGEFDPWAVMDRVRSRVEAAGLPVLDWDGIEIDEEAEGGREE